MVHVEWDKIKTLTTLIYLKLYEEKGKELCVIVTNVTKMSVVYLHPKVSPNVPISLAVRMSTSLPGINNYFYK